MTLRINTQNQYQVTVELYDNNNLIDQGNGQNQFGSQILLTQIIDMLDRTSLNLNALSKIEVATGPGSFTGLRVGVSVANALGFALGITVNNQKMETLLQYS